MQMQSELVAEPKTSQSVEALSYENQTFSEDLSMTSNEVDPVHYPKFIYIVVTSEYGRTWNQDQTPFLNLEKAIEFAKSEVDERNYYDVIVKKYEINNNGQDYQECFNYEFIWKDD